jgi:hypothetical protein
MAECLEAMVKTIKSSNPIYDPMTPFNVVSIIGNKHFKINLNPEDLRATVKKPLPTQDAQTFDIDLQLQLTTYAPCTTSTPLRVI